MNFTQIRPLIIFISTAAPLLFLSCVGDFDNPSYYDDLIDKEFEFCLAYLRANFLFRDSLPNEPYVYNTPESLYISVMDSNTEYLANDKARDFVRYTGTGYDSSLGIEIDSVYSGALITYIYPSSPADVAQLKYNDTIVAINNETIAGKNIETVMGLLGSSSGKTKDLQIKRDSVFNDTLDIDGFFLPSVYVDSVNDSTGYLLISTFLSITNNDGGSSHEIKLALEQLHWAKNIVIDLSGNSFGELYQSAESASSFLPESTDIIWSFEWNADSIALINFVTADNSGDTIQNKQIFLIFNASTAGAAEIFGSALIENGIVQKSYGNKSYGFGTSQIYDLTPLENVAKVTCGATMSISGNLIEGNGLIPDVQIVEKDSLVNEVLKDVIKGDVNKKCLERIWFFKDKLKNSSQKPVCINNKPYIF